MEEPVRIPRNVLDDLESVGRYTRVEVLDISTLPHVAMETCKPAPDAACKDSSAPLHRTTPPR